MDYVTFGRTGLKVSAAGLGCGGFSRLGLANGKSEAEAAALVRRAVDLGVTLFDTAAAYGTEGVVGKGLAGIPRDKVVIATKASIRKGEERCTVEQILASLDNSLKELRTDYIDVFQLHGVPLDLYDYARNTVAPALEREREKGKFRHFGVTETAVSDIRTNMLQRAAMDDVWESFMLAFHMMHQVARRTVLPMTRAKGIGTLVMFAVRSIFVEPARVAKVIAELAATGKVAKELADKPDPLGFLIHAGGASSLTDAAYRFARHEPGIDVVLFGTGDVRHMEANIASLMKPPLPEADRRHLADLFGHLLGVGLEGPGRPAKVETV
ncbi:MAG: aldo/keto reductase [Proteobacteria bacterium]|nr:aldo/keto reductase [Pseudomonadota bacterium]MBI3497679.1 aldo/keto reductase [Pseudomonadota bacterium]